MVTSLGNPAIIYVDAAEGAAFRKFNMAKALVIVESPAKAKTINKYLGKQFVVKASLGHIKDLPKRDLAVDVEHGFEPHYEVIEGKKKLISELKHAAKKVDERLPGGRPRPRGRSHLLSPAGRTAETARTAPRFFRVMFNEITKKAIEKAFEKPGQVNINLVEAQQARRVLDRLVGYKISPLLWDKVRRGLSAGRVQTVALRVIVEREREIRAFVRRGILDHRRRSGAPRSRRILMRAPDQGRRRDARDRRAGSRRRHPGPARRRRLRREVGGHARKEAQSGGAVHHLHPAAGVLAQTALQREAHHDAGAAPV